MKKLLFSAGVFLMGTVAMFAQFPNIGILGGSTVVDWDSDLDMTTTDGIIYTYEGLVIEVPPVGQQPDPGVKFRQDDAWTLNWGGAGFPSGTAGPSGANIPATNGTYDVTFNLNTLAYSFVPAGVDYDEVYLMNGATSMALLTDDGVSYRLDNVTFDAASNVAFSIDDTETGWGSNAFPSGTAVAGQMIPVPANSYNIGFNLDTKAYSFDFVTISLVGTGVFPDDPLWTTDLDLTTTNGDDYTINSFNFPGGEAKFRLNHLWATAWGSADFPSGTATTGESPNLNITAGTYSVTFKRTTGAFSFGAPTAGTEGFNKSSITVFPNPAQNAWNFNAGSNTISSMQIVDVTGKVVYSASVNAAQATVNASGFASGMYFARLTSGNATETIRLVKN